MGLSGWQYCANINIDNTGNSNALSDYQQKVVLDSSNFDFSKAKSDGGDIRFLDSDDSTPLSYWIENWDSSGQTATVWVKVPSIPASSNYTIYMYFGNASATSESNGTSTFEFFDDFETFDSTDWEKEGGTLTNVTDPASSGRGQVLKFDGGGSWYAFRKTTYTFTDGVIEFEFYRAAGNYLQFCFRISALGSKTLYEYEAQYDGDLDFQKFVNGPETIDMNVQPAGITDSTWHKGKITASGSNFTYWVDGTKWITQTDTDISSGNLGGRCKTVMYLNDVRVHKYTSPEPTTSVGAIRTVSNAIFFGCNF